MEQEQFFLFVIYQQKQVAKDAYYDHQLTLKRATIRRDLREYEKFKRIPIEFDPLDHHICYIVGLFTDLEDRYKMKNIFEPVEVFLTENEAVELKNKIETNKGKGYISKKSKETFNRVEIFPMPILMV